MAEISYDSGQQWVLNLILAVMILGLALDIRPRDFLSVFKAPKAPVIGLLAQFLLLPAFTYLLTLMVDLEPGIELGMILVAACPGGAMSNFITHLSGGNTALSISITAVASVLAIFMLPINFVFWANLNPETQAMLQSINVSGGDIFASLIVVLAIPLALGFFIQWVSPRLSELLHKGLKYFGVFALFVFIFAAVAKNFDHFIAQFWLLLAIVFIHNGLALGLGYAASSVGHLPGQDKKAITLEVGMQNSSLAIAIVFSQFGGEYGMALISAFWGTWHIVSGLSIAGFFKYKKLNSRGLSE
jgi:BASS family bile acid:Na+ symporter